MAYFPSYKSAACRRELRSARKAEKEHKRQKQAERKACSSKQGWGKLGPVPLHRKCRKARKGAYRKLAIMEKARESFIVCLRRER